MKIAIILFDVNLKLFDLSSYYKIGVDAGALNAVKSGLTLDLAIADFDSVSLDDFKLIETYSKKVIKLNPIKDKSDTEEAFDIALGMSNDITIFGGIQGNRIEHFLSILSLFNKNQNLKIIDNNSLIFVKDKSFEFKKNDYSLYKFVSIFSLDDDLNISLSGFKYNLNKYNLKRDNVSLTISNEMVLDDLFVDINKKTLFIFSKADNQNNLD